MTPSYHKSLFFSSLNEVVMPTLMAEIPWEQRTETRLEAFQTDPSGVPYTYGKDKGLRHYRSAELHPFVRVSLEALNTNFDSEYNGVFLNYYRGQKDHLGWHSDDFEGMDQNHPVAVVSYGSEREIWWREIGEKDKAGAQLLEPCSIFIMPAGFQQKYQHRIPKTDRPVGPRISLTFRKFLKG